MIALPQYIDPEAWDGFTDMRRRIRAPLTPRAAKLILYELQRIKDAGHDPNAALDQSTMLGWRDVWPPKDKQISRAAESGVKATSGVLADLESARRAAMTPEAQEARRRAMAAIKGVA